MSTGPAIVVGMTDAQRLDIGDTPPAFTLPNDSGYTTSLSDFAGERVVVYFYPAASTPGCTVEACDFRDSYTFLQQQGYVLLGLSSDAPEKNAAFAADEVANAHEERRHQGQQHCRADDVHPDCLR